MLKTKTEQNIFAPKAGNAMSYLQSFQIFANKSKAWYYSLEDRLMHPITLPQLLQPNRQRSLKVQISDFLQKHEFCSQQFLLEGF